MQTTIQASQGPDAARLALKLVEWHLGTLCKDVINCLIKYGRQSFVEIRQLSRIPVDDLKLAMIVLIQQNLVTAYLHTSPYGFKTEHVYEADLYRILHFIRIPRMITHVKRLFAGQPIEPACNAILMALILNGRLQMLQLPRAVRPSSPEEPEITPELLREALAAMIKVRLIEKTPSCLLPPPPNRVHSDAQKKRATPKEGTEEALAVAEKERIEAVRAMYMEERFMYTMPSVEDFAKAMKEAAAAAASDGAGVTDANDVVVKMEDDGDPGPSNGRGKRGSSYLSGKDASSKRAKVGELASLATAEMEATIKHKFEEGDQEEDKGAVLWRINYGEFDRYFCNEEISNMFTDTYSKDAGHAVLAMLYAGTIKKRDRVKGEMYSPEVTADEIVRASQRLGGDGNGQSWTISKVTSTLNPFTNKSPPLINLIGGRYSMDLQSTLGMIKIANILCIIQNRYSDSAKRIWNMLLLEGQMEQKMIADKSMVPAAEARQALYAMLKDGFLSLQDIPRHADRAPSRTFYTWRATAAGASVRVAQMLYKTAGNLLERLNFETTSNAALFKQIELVNNGRMDESQLDEHAVKRLKYAIFALELTLLRVGGQIALFNDY